MKDHFTKTKIIATVGPACSEKVQLISLIKAGVDVFRLNFSHGTHEEHLKVIQSIREINKEYDVNVAILQDLQGPKIRVQKVEKEEGILLETGKKIWLSTSKEPSTTQRITTSYPYLSRDVRAGDVILLDDGKIQLKAIQVEEEEGVWAEIQYGGILKANKGINLPKTSISMPSLTEKDTKDLYFGLAQDVDWIALSFVRSHLDLLLLKHLIRQKGKLSKVIAKVEKPQAIEEIDLIIQASDAVMVARGDLGVEINIEEVPIAQKMIVKKCIQAAKPVIIATQMLESMIQNPKPTRAETNDIANAVMDGADVLMLSGETAIGKHPVQVIESMRKTIEIVESKTSVIYHKHKVIDKASDSFYNDSVVAAACILAEDTGAKAIVGMTNSGYTAFQVASQRPRADIFIFTSNETLLNKLNLIWGVRAFYYDNFESTDHTFQDVQNILIEKGFLEKGDLYINMASMPISKKQRTNTIKLSLI